TIMSIRNTITEEIILPLSDLILGQSINKHLRFLLKSQYWTKDELESYQNKQLRKLITHSYKYVKYYHELFDKLGLKPEDIRTKEDLHKIPILTKEDIKREGLENFTSTAFSKKRIDKISSSGSTGEPLQFYKTKHSSSFNKAAAIRAWYWHGYRLGDKYVKISMNPRTSFVKQLQDRLNNCKYLSSNQLVRKEFQEIANEISRFDPKIIRCYPVPLLFLTAIIKDFGNKIGDSLLAINTTGSTLHDDSRNKIEEVFKRKIFDGYSCEGGAICSQCETHENYHFAEEYAISEFIEDDYTKADPEHPVRHITTDLQDYATPFIRYDSQDYIVLGNNSPCSCGRAYQNIKKIKGRDSDILLTPSGKYLIVENFVAYFQWVESVEQIQVVQNSINSIVINLVINEKFSQKVHVELLNYWRKYIGSDVNLTIELVNEIKLTPSGKRRTLIRNPEIKINL
ncbi:phenylacetate--CoA ligase family protein, partial [Bacteroidota bacterium]